MEKFDHFKLDEETMKSWLDVFNNRLQGHDMGVCNAIGRGVMKKIPKRATWDEVRAELFSLLAKIDCLYFVLWDRLINYSSGNEGLGGNRGNYFNRK